MEPQHPPFEMARSSDMGKFHYFFCMVQFLSFFFLYQNFLFQFSGIGLHSWNMENNGSNRREKSPPIGLGLELGSGSGKKSTRTTSFGFTIFQHQELHLQSLIYKYLEAGLPVPYHLVIPIWKSVANSSISLSNGVHQLFPSRKSKILLNNYLL